MEEFEALIAAQTAQEEQLSSLELQERIPHGNQYGYEGARDMVRGADYATAWLAEQLIARQTGTSEVINKHQDTADAKLAVYNKELKVMRRRAEAGLPYYAFTLGALEQMRRTAAVFQRSIGNPFEVFRDYSHLVGLATLDYIDELPQNQKNRAYRHEIKDAPVPDNHPASDITIANYPRQDRWVVHVMPPESSQAETFSMRTFGSFIVDRDDGSVRELVAASDPTAHQQAPLASGTKTLDIMSGTEIHPLQIMDRINSAVDYYVATEGMFTDTLFTDEDLES